MNFMFSISAKRDVFTISAAEGKQGRDQASTVGEVLLITVSTTARHANQPVSWPPVCERASPQLRKATELGRNQQAGDRF